MKIKLLTLVCLYLALTGCSKSNQKPATQPTNAVNINGTSYPTAKIGTQTWTSINYNGPGGVSYENFSNNPNYGKLYLLSEARAIALPVGWRLPTSVDAVTLLSYLGAAITTDSGIVGDSSVTKKIKSKDQGFWITKGNNSSGFNAISGGEFISSYNDFTGLGMDAMFWLNSDGSGNPGSLEIIDVHDGGALITNTVGVYIFTSSYFSDVNKDMYSIRFVKDN